MGAQTILRAEHNKPINAESRRLLCEYFGMTSEELGLVTDENPPHPHPFNKQDHQPPLSQTIAQGIVLAAQELENPHMDKSRRNFLQALGLAGTALVAPITVFVPSTQELPHTPVWERLSQALEHPSSIDEITLLQLEATIGDCWNVLPKVSGAFSHGLLNYVLGQLEVVTTLLDRSPSANIRQRLAFIAGELAQVSGEILFDLKENAKAERYYDVAISAAKVAQNDSMQAIALGRKSFIPIYENDAGRALPLLQQAKTLLPQDAPSITRAWLSAVEAEALANMHEELACRRALEQSEKFLERVQPGETSSIRFSRTALLGYKGICSIRLQEPQTAQAILTDALLSMEPHRIRHKSIVLIDLATTYIQRGEIEEACRYASQALILITHTKSARVLQRILIFRRQLEPWKTVIVVKHLDEQIAAVLPFVTSQRDL